MLKKKFLAAAAILGIAGLGAGAHGIGPSAPNTAPTAAWNLKTLNGAPILYVDVKDADGAADLKSVRFNFFMRDGTILMNAYAEALVRHRDLIVSDIDGGKRYRFMPVPSGLDKLLLVARDNAGHELNSTFRVPQTGSGAGPKASPGTGAGGGMTKR